MSTATTGPVLRMVAGGESGGVLEDPAIQADTELDFLTQEILRVREIEDGVKKDLAEVGEYLNELEGRVMAEFTTLGIRACTGRDGTNFALVQTRRFGIEDYDAFRKWILETGRLDLLHRRVTEKAADEILEATGELVPGLSVANKVGIRIRKGR